MEVYMAGPEHECRQGRKCKARIKNAEGQFHGVGVERPESLCRPCEDSAFEAIRQLSHDYGQLQGARTDRRVTASAPRVSGSSERPIPIQPAVDALMEEVDDEALRWTLRITRGDELPPDPGSRVARCITILSANLGTLIDLPVQVVTAWFPYPNGGDWDGHLQLDGVDAVLRLARLHERAVTMLGVDEPKMMWLRESCHVCGLAALTMDPEGELITCRGCRNVWHQQEFARLNMAA